MAVTVRQRIIRLKRRRRGPLYNKKVRSRRWSAWLVVLLSLVIVAVAAAAFHRHYTVSFQSPIRIKLVSPVVVSERILSEDALRARGDQRGRALSAWQQYTCQKFGSDCRLALAIQRAENPQGKCEIYHYNSDGTLDWGYFQINTVHLKRLDLNLHDLLDCKANIDFAYQLYREKAGFSAWSTFRSGKYRQFLQ